MTRRFMKVVAMLLAVGAVTSARAARELQTRTFKLTYQTLVRQLPPGTQTLDIWLPYPQTDRNQVIHTITVNTPGKVTIGRERRFGNQSLHFRQDHPRVPMTLELVITATRRENAGSLEVLSASERADCLAPEPLVPLDGPVKAMAVQAVLGKKSVGERARALYENVTRLLKYDKSGTGWGRGDALYACDARRGNCTDFHALLIGMARSQGIPARFAIGFSLPAARGTAEIPGYHCWAELYLNGKGWVPVDASEAAKALANGDAARKDYFYGHHDENRIEFSRGRNLTLLPEQRSGPLNFFIEPLVEVDGKRFDGAERKVSVSDL